MLVSPIDGLADINCTVASPLGLMQAYYISYMVLISQLCIVLENSITEANNVSLTVLQLHKKWYISGILSDVE